MDAKGGAAVSVDEERYSPQWWDRIQNRAGSSRGRHEGPQAGQEGLAGNQEAPDQRTRFTDHGPVAPAETGLEEGRFE